MAWTKFRESCLGGAKLIVIVIVTWKEVINSGGSKHHCTAEGNLRENKTFTPKLEKNTLNSFHMRLKHIFLRQTPLLPNWQEI